MCDLEKKGHLLWFLILKASKKDIQIRSRITPVKLSNLCVFPLQSVVVCRTLFRHEQQLHTLSLCNSAPLQNRYSNSDDNCNFIMQQTKYQLIIISVLTENNAQRRICDQNWYRMLRKDIILRSTEEAVRGGYYGPGL